MFSWGSLKFNCVVEKVSVSYLMFTAAGTPIRAKVTVSLMERGREEVKSKGNSKVTLSAMGSMFQADPGSVSMTTVQPGETLSQVADRTGGDFAAMAQANSVLDPTALAAGQQLVVTDNMDLANVLAASSLADVASSTFSEDSMNPFGDLAESLTDTFDNLGSAFDDVGVSLMSAAEDLASSAEQVAATVDNAAQSMNSVVDNLEESVNSVVDNLEESVNSVVDNAEESMNSVVDNLEESVNSVVDNAEESINAVIETPRSR